MGEKLEEIAKEIRIDILKMYWRAGWGHLSPALSCVDILVALYFGNIVNRNSLFNEEHDHVILSKGHACAALYAVLARLGYLSRDELNTFYQKGSRLSGLASSAVPGIEVPTGSLGHGLSFATGTAMAAKIKNIEERTYVILGDGESQEGSVWEAAMFASNHNLNNLIVILDHNRLQASGWVDNIASIHPIREKWESFGWKVCECNGHDLEALVANLHLAVQHDKSPTILIANTIKGKGLSFAENNPQWHSRAPKGDEWDIACKDLGITMRELSHV